VQPCPDTARRWCCCPFERGSAGHLVSACAGRPSADPCEEITRVAGVTSVTGNLHSHGNVVYNTANRRIMSVSVDASPGSVVVRFLRPPPGARTRGPLFLASRTPGSSVCGINSAWPALVCSGGAQQPPPGRSRLSGLLGEAIKGSENESSRLPQSLPF
jgi:hypothetical protein